MPPLDHESRSRGGSATAATSEAKAAALRALHDSRRGVRLNRKPRGMEKALAAARVAIQTKAKRGTVSIRALAAHCGVSDRTARRWLSGEDWPPATQVRRMREWVRARAAGSKTSPRPPAEPALGSG